MVRTTIFLAATFAGGVVLGQAVPAPTSTVLNRASLTVTGQPLALPGPAVEVIISRIEIPAGGALPMHKHPWPRYAIVESGRLRIHYEEARLVREFGPGEAVIEAIDQWHEAQVVGPEPLRIIVIDHVPPGQNNVVRR
jgi:quercetin dioxygenase-like cupin family protein